MGRKKLMIHDIYRMKENGEKSTFLPFYDFPTAQFAEAAGLDCNGQVLVVSDMIGRFQAEFK